MLQYFVAYLITAIVFFAIDFVWLGKVAKPFYYGHLAPMLLERPNMVAAAGFYTIYVVGIIIFAVSPALRDGSVSTALIYGALFGFFTYATYDMTNYATLRDWPGIVVIVDIIWGTCLTATAATLGYLGTRAIFPA